MAWYYGTFNCGCEGRVNIVGPQKQREWKMERAFSKMCESCYTKYLEEKRIVENKEAEKLAKEMELPELSGSEKQIAWANTLRQSIIDKFNKLDDYNIKEILSYSDRLNSIDDINLVFDFILINRTESKYYIDYRYKSLETLLRMEANNVILNEKEELEKKREQEIIEEGTIAPEKSLYPGVVYIEVKGNIIRAKYQKEDKFINIVKGLDYSWGTCWHRNINKLNGPIIDRVAELGNKLLNAGFIVCIKDKEAREKAVNGTYEKEITRWIIKSANVVKIIWNGKNDNLYRAAKRIKSAKWDNGIIVNIENYEAIREFARLYEFKIDDDAEELLSKYEEEERNLTRVVAKHVEDVELPADGLKEVLNSSRDVIEDLMEDDE